MSTKSVIFRWREIIKLFYDRKHNQIAKKGNCLLICDDARTAILRAPEESIDCIITSPPYGNLKNYGSEYQIGFGQDTNGEYLPDLENILKQLLRVATPGASLWLVLDTWKESGESFPLPWEIIDRARKAGWTFHDTIIWDKGRSLPWTHPGRFRAVCEFILLFGKGALANFNLSAVRETDNLSVYWTKYPERFHPDGKAPTDLWHFPIPTQGSWAKRKFRHFCPFPPQLVARIIAISTRKDSIVLDPFAGTGTVLTVAKHLGRRALGFEINTEFVTQFINFGYDEVARLAAEQVPNRIKRDIGSQLRRTMIELRMQKFPRTLFAELSRKDRLGEAARNSVGGFLIENVKFCGLRRVNIDTRSLGSMDLYILARDNANLKRLTTEVEKLIDIPPLSKFGLEVNSKIVSYGTWRNSIFWSQFRGRRKHMYKGGRFYYSEKTVAAREVRELLLLASGNFANFPTIFSQILVKVVNQT